MTVGGMGFIPERLLMMMMMNIALSSYCVSITITPEKHAWNLACCLNTNKINIGISLWTCSCGPTSLGAWEPVSNLAVPPGWNGVAVSGRCNGKTQAGH